MRNFSLTLLFVAALAAVLAAALAGTGTAWADTITDANVVARYVLNGNATDISGNGYNGVNTNSSVSWINDPVRGTVASFNGAGQINVGASGYAVTENNKDGAQFAISFWIKPGVYDYDNDSITDFNCIMGGTTAGVIEILGDRSWSNWGSPSGNVGVNSGGGGGSASSVPGINLYDGSWHHIVIQWFDPDGTVAGNTGSKAQIWIDGSSAAMGTQSYSGNGNVGSMVLGGPLVPSNGGGTLPNYYLGLMSDVTFFNAQLTQTDVNKLLAATVDADYTWNVSGGDGLWATGGNWGGTAPDNASNVRAIVGVSGTDASIDLESTARSVHSLRFTGDVNTTITGTGTLHIGKAGADPSLIEVNHAGLTNQADVISCPVSIDGFGQATIANAGDQLTFSGVVSGAGELRLTSGNAGTVVLTQANPLAGSASVYGGTLKITDRQALQNAIVTVTGTGTLDVGSVAGQNVVLGSLAGDRGIALGAGTALTVGGNNNSMTYSGALSGSGATLTKLGTGEMALAGSSTYDGMTTVSEGKLTVAVLADGGSPSSVGQSGSAAGNLVMGNGTTLKYAGAGSTTNRQFTIGGASLTLDASGAGAVNFTGTADLTYGTADAAVALTLTGANAGDNILAARITNNGSGAVSVTKSGTGTWVLTGTNTYAGPTAVAGKLRADDAVGLSAASSLTLNGGILETGANLARAAGSGAGQMQITGGVSGFSAKGGAVQVAFGTLGSPSPLSWGYGSFLPSTLVLNDTTADSAIELKNSIDLAGLTRTVNVNAGTATATFSGNGGAGLTKGGSGTLILKGANTYVNTTSVTGTLRAASTGSFSAYSPFSLSSATLDLDGHNSSIGSLTGSGSVLLGAATLTVGGDNSSPAAFSGLLGSTGSPAASLVKTGKGKLTLSGNNTYSGATDVNGGMLLINGDQTAATGAVAVAGGAYLGSSGTGTTTAGTVGGAVTVNAGAGINLAAATGGGAFTLNSTLALNGTAASPNLLFFGSSSSKPAKIAAAGAVTSPSEAGGGIVYMRNATGLANNTYSIITAASGITPGNFSLATTRGFQKTFSLGGSDTALQVTVAAGTAGAAQSWNGTTDANWNTASNWSGGAVPGYSSAVTMYNTAANLDTTLDSDFEISTLTYPVGATSSTTIGGTKMLSIAGTTTAITVNTPTSGTPTHTISANVGMEASQTWTVNTGASLTVSGNVTDFGAGFALTKAGAGTLVLSGKNTFSGDISINAGTLQAGTGANLGIGGGGTGGYPVVLNGGILSLINGTGTDYGRGVRSTGTQTINFGGGGTNQTHSLASVKLTGVNQGTTLKFTGTSGYNLNVGASYGEEQTYFANYSNGTVTLASLTRTGTGASGTRLSLNAVGDLVIGDILGRWYIEKNGNYGGDATCTGTVVLNGTNNTYDGSTTVGIGTLRAAGTNAGWGTTTINSGGSLQIANDNPLAGGTLTLNANSTISAYGGAHSLNNAVTWGGNFTIGGTRNLAFTGTTTTGSRTVTVNNTGATTLGAVTLSGDCTFNFANGSGNVNMNGAVTLTGNRTLTVAQAGTAGHLLIGGAVQNDASARGLTKAGAGLLELSNANTYTGATTVNAGALMLGQGGSMAATAVSVNGTATYGMARTSGGASVQGGSTLSMAIGTTLDLQDGYTNTMNFTDTGGSALNGAGLYFDLGASGACDTLALAGTATVADTNKFYFDFDVLGSPTTGNHAYTLITALSGLLTGGTFDIGTTLPGFILTLDRQDAAVYLNVAIDIVPGDTNGDKVVDAADYIAVKQNLGLTTGATLGQGNVDGDGDVDWDDLQLVMTNFGTGSGTTPATTPEPCSAMLLVLGAMAVVRRRARIGRISR